MSTMFEVNGKKISHKDLNIVRDFFTDEQWDLIDYALSEYQDHDDSQEILDTIGGKLQNVFDNSVDQSDLMSEGA